MRDSGGLHPAMEVRRMIPLASWPSRAFIGDFISLSSYSAVNSVRPEWNQILLQPEEFILLNTGYLLGLMSPGPGRPKASTTEMKRVEVAINPELLDLFDAWWKSNHFPTRNEALRQILRERVDGNGARTAVN